MNIKHKCMSIKKGLVFFNNLPDQMRHLNSFKLQCKPFPVFTITCPVLVFVIWLTMSYVTRCDNLVCIAQSCNLLLVFKIISHMFACLIIYTMNNCFIIVTPQSCAAHGLCVSTFVNHVCVHLYSREQIYNPCV